MGESARPLMYRCLYVLVCMAIAPCWDALAGEQRLTPASAEYSRFVEAYHGGNFTGSVASLVQWPDNRVRDAVRDATRAAADASVQGRGVPASLLMSRSEERRVGKECRL